MTAPARMGELWYRIGGGTYRILGHDTAGRLRVLNMHTGDREWVDAAEFTFKHKPVKPWVPRGVTA